MNRFEYPLGSSIGFDKIYDAVLGQWESLRTWLDELISEKKIDTIDYVISEIPPPNSEFSSGLYALDTFILNRLFETYTFIKGIYIVYPSYLGTVHGFAKYKKSDSTKLAKFFLSEVFEDKYEVIIPDNISESGRRTKGQINNDKAESFLFLLRLFVKYNIDGLSNKITSIMSGLGYEGEKLLVTREK